jgi:hypothetical protein
MLAHRKLFILFLASSMALAASTALAQETNWDQRLAEQKKERDATLGVLSISQYPLALSGYGHIFWLVDLSLRDRDTNAPYLYTVTDADLTIGRTYKAHMVNGQVRSIVINGVPVTMKEESWGKTSTTLVCDSRPSPEGGHWELTANGFKCAAGVKETVKWKADKGSKQEAVRSNQRSNIPTCDLQQPFHDTVLTVVISVTPESNLQWTFPEAPSHVAQRILADLNANRRNRTFKEASGVVPNLYINVTVNETGAGTKQDTAYAIVTGLGKAGTLFSVNSGQAPFVGLGEAIDHLSSSMLTFFEGGWHKPSPCVIPNGEVLP